jgi:hypothetical protein
MNNDEIISNIAATIYGKDEVDNMIAHGQEVPVHTALGWRMRGPYKIKDGEKPIEVKLWKKRIGASESGSNSQKPQFYLSKAYLYCREQMERVEG